jgi:hypothetical protein
MTVDDANGASVEDFTDSRITLNGARVFEVSAGSTTVNLVCRLVTGTGTKTVFVPTVTALFTPSAN